MIINLLRHKIEARSSVWKAIGAYLRHFFKNSQEYREVTEQYPDPVSSKSAEDMVLGFRGYLYNDINKCSGCKFCVDQCPTKCIDIDVKRGPVYAPAWVVKFQIDHSKCLFCGLCVSVCPTNSLIHTKEFLSESYIMDFGRGPVVSNMRQSENDGLLSQANEQAALVSGVDRSPVATAVKEYLRRNKNDNDT